MTAQPTPLQAAMEEAPAPKVPALFESAATLLSEPDPGPPPFTVDGLLADGGVCAILGAPKVGKTWVTLEMAVCVVTGRPAFGRYEIPRPGPVVTVLEESGRSALHRRLDRLSRGHGVAPGDLADLHFATNRGVRLDEAEWRANLLAQISDLAPRLVVFDPLVRVKGAADENSQKEIGPVLDFFRELRNETGATVLFVHHTGHNEPGRMRGSSDLEGYWESKIVLTHDAKTSVRTIAAEHRESPATPRLEYRLDEHERTETIALTPLTPSRIEAADRLQEEVEKYVRDHPGQITPEIVSGVGRNAEKVRKALEAGRLAGPLWKASRRSDHSGQLIRRGSWWPSAHAAIQPELSGPDPQTTSDQSPTGGEVVRVVQPLGGDHRDHFPGPDHQPDENTLVETLAEAFDATEETA